jgi:hypothetical protein
MTCQELAERMPAVVRGSASWSAVEVEHLRVCADCRAEWALVRAGAAVAQGVSPDVEAMAARVVGRLRTEPMMRPRRPLRWVAAVAVAAAAVVLVVVPFATHRAPPVPPAPVPFSVDVPGLDGLGDAELERVLETVEMPWTETSTADSPSLDDLNDQELARVAREWES